MPTRNIILLSEGTALVILAAVSLLVYIGITALRAVPHPPPVMLLWDFTAPPDTPLKGNLEYNISRVGWPASNHSNGWLLKGQFDLTMKRNSVEDHGVRIDCYFHETAQTISVDREGDAIVHIVVHFDTGAPVDEGFRRAKNVLEKWSGGIDNRPQGGRYKTLDEWFDGVKRGENVDGQYYVRGHYGATLTITIFGPPQDALHRTCILSLVP